MALRPGPVRSCVGCRKRAVAAELLRVVAVEGVLVPDPARRLPGRGASLHLDPDCLAVAERRRAFPRALRVGGPLEVATLREYVGQHARRSPAAGTNRQVSVHQAYRPSGRYRKKQVDPDEHTMKPVR